MFWWLSVGAGIEKCPGIAALVEMSRLVWMERRSLVQLEVRMTVFGIFLFFSLFSFIPEVPATVKYQLSVLRTLHTAPRSMSRSLH